MYLQEAGEKEDIPRCENPGILNVFSIDDVQLPVNASDSGYVTESSTVALNDVIIYSGVGDIFF